MYQVLAGDCREVMATLEAESVDAIVTDPPYELGFMGKSWDASGVAFDPETWRHALRVLKPGGHLLAFSGSRTYHRMACAIEDAGFEIRDQIMWVYGSGFPKSHDVSKAIDREAGAEREVVGPKVTGDGHIQNRKNGTNEYGTFKIAQDGIDMITAPATDAARTWSGWGTALKPAHEPIVVARKPFKGTVAQNVIAHGTGALNIDGCRVDALDGENRSRDNSKCKPDTFFGGKKRINQVIETGTGRWPANFIHDGSDEVLRLFPETTSGSRKAGQYCGARGSNSIGNFGVFSSRDIAGDSGSAARFFYVPKASKRDREDGLDGFVKNNLSTLAGSNRDGSLDPVSERFRSPARSNHHPTVKPTDLMRYLCRLVTPPGGLVLDPFTGSGSTGRGAVLEGFRFIGIEMDAGYREIAIARIQAAERSSPHGAS